MGKPRKRQSRVTRDMVLFVTGLAGVLYETVVERADRPALLAVFAGMLGLPIYLRRDEKHDDDRHDGHDGRGE